MNDYIVKAIVVTVEACQTVTARQNELLRIHAVAWMRIWARSLN